MSELNHKLEFSTQFACKGRQMSGFTVFELMIVLLISSVVMATGIANLRHLHRPSRTTAALVQSYFKEVRARAISQTRAYKVRALSEREIEASYAEKCSASSSSFVKDNKMTFKVPSETKILTPSWSVCFSSRGIADSNILIYLRGEDGETRTLELLLGGAIREVV